MKSLANHTQNLQLKLTAHLKLHLDALSDELSWCQVHSDLPSYLELLPVSGKQ